MCPRYLVYIMAIPFFILAGNFLTHGGVVWRGA
jgi:TRAP-type C4-dicarboxylate transport system permease large subunit